MERILTSRQKKNKQEDESENSNQINCLQKFMMTDSIIEGAGFQLEEGFIESPLKNSGSKLIAALNRNQDEELKMENNSILEDSIYND